MTPTPATISQLGIIAERAIEAVKSARTCQMLAGVAGARQAEDEARKTAEAIASLLALLEELGADSRAHNSRAGLDTLAQLETLSTPSSQCLARKLHALLPLAEIVDAERGNVLPESVTLRTGETRGTDLAETIGALAQRLNREVFGPKGRDL